MAKKTKPEPQPLVLQPRAGAWPADKTERRSVKDLLAYPQNPRVHSDEQIDALVRSLNEFGWTMPILVDEGVVCIAGHGRLQAANRMGIAEVPVMVASGWTEEQKRAYRIADNALTEASSWSPQLLKIELEQLALTGYDLKLTGFDDFNLVQYMAKNRDGDPEVTPDPPETPVSKSGDLWLLGKHRLLCGSSTQKDDVIRLMDGEKASLFSTDPPYAVGYIGGSHPESDANRGSAKRDKNWSKVYHEADNEGDGETFYKDFIRAAVDHAIEENAAWYCWHSSIRAPMVERVWNEHGAFAHQQIIWVKTRSVLTYSVYMWQHEPCLMGWIRGNKPAIKSRDQEFNSTIWNVPNSEVESKHHPTSKPTRLFRLPMEVHTLPGELCYEPFSGSGSQIIAAEMLSRRCYAMEIEPVFIDVAVIRWQDYTKQQATLEATGQTFDEVARERLTPPSRARKNKKAKSTSSALQNTA